MHINDYENTQFDVQYIHINIAKDVAAKILKAYIKFPKKALRAKTCNNDSKKRKISRSIDNVYNSRLN